MPAQWDNRKADRDKCQATCGQVILRVLIYLLVVVLCVIALVVPILGPYWVIVSGALIAFSEIVLRSLEEPVPAYGPIPVIERHEAPVRTQTPVYLAQPRHQSRIGTQTDSCSNSTYEKECRPRSSPKSSIPGPARTFEAYDGYGRRNPRAMGECSWIPSTVRSTHQPPIPVPQKQSFNERLVLQPKLLLPYFVYHYTDRKGYEGIMQSLIILSSEFLGRKNGTRYGDGVYLTTLGPNTTTGDLITKNHGSSFQSARLKAKTQFTFQLRSQDLMGLKRINDGYVERTETILLYPGFFIFLTKIPFRVYKRSVEDSPDAGVFNMVELLRDVE